MSAHAEDGQQPIIIVRRHSDHEDGHHGGAWKIAFADFMTALMCFFLVMWLINAANEQTKASVASYFNPVKLVDRNTARKGLEDVGDGKNQAGYEGENATKPAKDDSTVGTGSGGAAGGKASSSTAPQTDSTDASLFADPYAVLAEIASETGTKQNVSDKGDGGAQLSGPATGASGGEAFRDPFAPDFWSQQVAVPGAQASSERGGSQPSETPVATLSEAPKAEAAEAEKANEPRPSEKAEEVAAQLREALAKAFQPGDKAAEGISVTATDRGVVISVTDKLDFGMFQIGSAMPARELVLAMDKIGAAIRDEPEGTISVEGHTDGRPFRSRSYDNWRLSTARAQAAYYMLVRGGIDERRITSVSGAADRKLKLPNDPMAAENRRIDILIELPTGKSASAAPADSEPSPVLPSPAPRKAGHGGDHG